MEENKKIILTRRDALKALAAITGAATLANLPGKWEIPLIEVGALPAHAACSIVPGTVTFQVSNPTDGTFYLIYTGPYYNKSITVAPGGIGCLTGMPIGVELPYEEWVEGGVCDYEDEYFDLWDAEDADTIIEWEVPCYNTTTTLNSQTRHAHR